MNICEQLPVYFLRYSRLNIGQCDILGTQIPRETGVNVVAKEL